MPLDPSQFNVTSACPVVIPMRAPSNLPQPTRDLGPSGRDLWRSIKGYYAMTDLGGVEVLMEACAALDRAESLAAQIAADGPTIPGPSGPRVHPCIAAEIQCRNSVVRSLGKLGSSRSNLSDPWVRARASARKDGLPMVTNRTPIRRASRGALSGDQEQCLWLGVGRDKFPFDRRGRVPGGMGAAPSADHGRSRPQWAPALRMVDSYDAPEGIEFDYDRERSTLYEAGLLDADEAAALVEYWKLEFQTGARARIRVLRRARPVSQGPRGDRRRICAGPTCRQA